MKENFLKRLGGLRLLVLLILLAALPLTVFIAQKQQEVRQRAEEPTIQATTQTNIITICPSGTTGQGGCNYIGGEGIQQAVDAAPVGSAGGKTTILIKSGDYTRSNFSTFYTEGHPRKCFVDTKEKNLVFQGEGMGATKFNGNQSDNMSGICAKGGEIEVRNLTIFGFKASNYSCGGQSICSIGAGITLEQHTKAVVIGNTIGDNNNSNGNGDNYNSINGVNSAVRVIHNTQATIKNNLIYQNIGGVYVDGYSNLNLSNNTFYNNAKDSLLIQQYSGGIPQETVVNNIFVGGEKSIEVGSVNHLSFSYDLFLNNECGMDYDHDDGNPSPCETNTGSINRIDPRFVNEGERNFHLQAGSPAIDSGDPAIHDPDGGRSDMGAYGGPQACVLDPNLPGCTPPTPPPTATPILGNIAGYKVGPTVNGSDRYPPFDSASVTLDGGSPTTAEPYNFANVIPGNHTVAVTVPSGWTVGYTLCYSPNIRCHRPGDPDGYNLIPGNSAQVNVTAGGGADLWWHFTPPPTNTPAPLAEDVDGNGCISIVDFNAWLYAFRNNGTPSNPSFRPDINGDGTVDTLDFNLWLMAFRSGQNLCT